MANAVATKKNAELSTDVLDDIMDFAGEGAAFDSSEMQIPFVRLLQPLSPQLNKKKSEYIDGASSGDAFNNVTGQYWDGGGRVGEVRVRGLRTFLNGRHFERLLPQLFFVGGQRHGDWGRA